MPTTRRMNGITASSKSPTRPSTRSPTAKDHVDPSSIPIPPPTHSAYLPTRTEALLLSIYPLTLLVGSLFSHLSPSLRAPSNASTYSEIHQSFQPASAAPSYFALKRNVFNVYFVKIGWFWCSLAFAAFALCVARGRSAVSTTNTSSNAATTAVASDHRLRRRWQAALRYAAATLAWFATTQWFFGPGLVDRGFALSGGVCEAAAEKLHELEAGGGGAGAAARHKEKVARVVTHAACRVAGGTWKGGWDISGHVFLLVLGSGMLWLEMLPFLVLRVKGLGLGRVVRGEDGEECRVIQEVMRGGEEFVAGAFDGTGEAKQGERRAWGAREYAMTLALAIAVLCWWMLLMTAAFFHTWFEKLTGCIWAFICLWVIYFAPRGQPGLRSILGMPGL